VNTAALFLTVFLACAVEAVEATTVVLAIGTAREWCSALTGVVAGLLLLACLVAALGPAVSAVPLSGYVCSWNLRTLPPGRRGQAWPHW
jgi:uncharacterized membrane protein